MSRSEDEAIIAEAARRLADRLCDGDANGDPELGAWRAQDPRHAARLAEMEAIWRDLPYAARPERPARRRPAMRPALWGTGIAAAAACLVIGADLPMRLEADLRTDVGERRREQLADGSLVQLDTDSAVAADYRPDGRHIRLLRGRAAFQVAPDRARPFTVEAAGGATTALGTQFVVARAGDGAEVAVTEHAVRVALEARGQVRVGEGQAVRYGADGLGLVHAADPGTAMAWTRGWMVFEDRPLGEVVEALARYHPGLIRVVGAGLAGRRVSGAIAIDDPDQAVATLQSLLRLRVTRLGSLVVIFHA